MRCGLKELLLCLVVLVLSATGAYEKDVHYHLTDYLAIWAGFSESEAGETDGANQAENPQFSFRMRDGSTLTGQLQEDNIKIKTAFGSLNVPVKDILLYGKGEFRLKNGSVVKGEMVNRALSFESKYGKLSLEPNDIAWFGFQAVPRKAEPNGEDKAKED